MPRTNDSFSLYDKSITIPENSVVEQTVLGLMLNDEEALETGLSLLSTEHFPNINNNHRAIYTAVKAVYDKAMSVDIVTVFNELKNNKLDDAVGGLDYLTKITDGAFTFSAIKDYCKQLQDLVLMRRALKLVDDYLYEYKTKKINDYNDFVGNLSRDVTKIAEERRILDFESMETTSAQLQEHLKKMKASGSGRLTGHDSGYADLNMLTHGLQPGNLVIIAARPAVGKTAFALNMAYNIAALNNKSVGFFSLEMGTTQLMMRLVSAQSQVDHKSIQTGIISNVDHGLVNHTLEKMQKVPLFIDQTGGISLNDLMMKSRKLKREHDNLAAIFVDYIGLITSTKRHENRQIEISEISRSLKELARELNIAVVALSQLSRGVESRENKRPTLSDLRESGSLEQDADVVLLMYREDYYIALNQMKPQNAVYGNFYESSINEKNKKLSPSLVDISVAKNRNGEGGNFVLMFFKAISKFDDLDLPTLSIVRNLQKSHHDRKTTT